jgi:phosphoserine phosphatase
MASHVATIISHPAAAVLTDNVLARLAAIVQSRDWHWLAAGVAADLPIDRPSSEHIRQVHESLHGLPVDIIIQPQDGRRKQLFVADMDSTMIGQECIDELADFVALKPFVAAITARAMRGEIAFEPALRERVALLKGLPVSVVDRVIRERLTLTAGAQTLIATLRAHGVYTVLVSGGFSLFTKAVAEMIGFDDHRGNVLSVADGKLAGCVQEPILGQQGKLECLQQLTQQRGLPKHLTMAIGDGANDLAMLQAAGLGVAFHAKPHVAAQASARIDHGDLTALLFAQGYTAHEFR